MLKAQIIECPVCGIKVATYDGKRTTDLVTRCTKCGRKIVFNVQTGVTTRKEYISRHVSSGMRFN